MDARSLKAINLFFLLFASAMVGAAPRSHAAKAEFQRLHPCPSTGERRGSCKNWVIDHRQALCTAGSDEERRQLDAPENMRWMTVDAAKAKDRWECKPGWEDRLRECELSGCFAPLKSCAKSKNDGDIGSMLCS